MLEWPIILYHKDRLLQSAVLQTELQHKGSILILYYKSPVSFHYTLTTTMTSTVRCWPFDPGVDRLYSCERGRPSSSSPRCSPIPAPFSWAADQLLLKQAHVKLGLILKQTIFLDEALITSPYLLLSEFSPLPPTTNHPHGAFWGHRSPHFLWGRAAGISHLLAYIKIQNSVYFKIQNTDVYNKIHYW